MAKFPFGKEISLKVEVLRGHIHETFVSALDSRMNVSLINFLKKKVAKELSNFENCQ